MKDLGMEIKKDKMKGTISLIRGIDDKTKLVRTPLALHFKSSALMSLSTDDEKRQMECVQYANADGALMYAMVCTRPDIFHDVSMESRYMHNPSKGHWQAVKWILRYIQGTIDIGLKFQKDKTIFNCLVGYADSDYAGDLDKRRSTTGYVFTMAGGLVTWRSTLQSTVALSTTEAEVYGNHRSIQGRYLAS